MAILTPDKCSTWNGLKVYEYLLTKHNPYNIDMPSKMTSKMIGVTIHNTEWIDVSSSTTPAEQYTRATVNGNMLDVRVHFYVDDKCAWQNLPLDYAGWHAADGNGNGNRRTIAIECIMSGNGGTASKKAEANCAKLAAYLLNKYGLTVENGLYTHSHWLNVKHGKTGSIDYLNTAYNTSKNCPIYILPHWNNFKNTVKAELKKLKPDTNAAPQATNIGVYRIRKDWDDAKTQVGAYADLDNAKKSCKEGYNVYDNNGNIVYSNSPTSAQSSQTANITYQVYAGGKWLGKITNCNDTNDNGYAGIENTAIRGLTMKVDKGSLRYRVHIKGGGWLSFITNCNTADWNKGCAGLRTRDIDAIQVDFSGIDGYVARYRVSQLGSKTYTDWVAGFNLNNYAGTFGKAIDKIQVEIVKKK